MKICEECGRHNPTALKRFCAACYARRRSAGMTIAPTLIERLWRRIERQPNGCWIWTGARDPNGYGRIGTSRNGKRVELVHRAMYEVLVEPIPQGLTLDHLCEAHGCCNPSHLEPLSAGENSKRSSRNPLMTAHRAGTCTKGHPISGENAARHGNRFECRQCKQDRRNQTKPERTLLT